MKLLATCCALAAMSAGTPPPDPHGGWEPLFDGQRRSLEIDRAGIVRDRGFVTVRVRSVGDRATVAAEFEAVGADPTQVERVRTTLDHSEHVWSFHCEGRTHALAYSAYFATDGSLIRAFTITRPSYWPVQPDTIGQRLHAQACTTERARDEGSAGDDAADAGR